MTGQRISLSLSLLACCAVLSFTDHLVVVPGLPDCRLSAGDCDRDLAGATLVSVEKQKRTADQIKQLFEAGTITPGDPR